MTDASPLAVYDGQRWIGSIDERDKRRFVATNSAGCVLGTFPTLREAADAITRSDRPNRAETSRS